MRSNPGLAITKGRPRKALKFMDALCPPEKAPRKPSMAKTSAVVATIPPSHQAMALSALAAAIPTCRDLIIEPKLMRNPDERLAAIAKAFAVCATEKPRKRATAAVAPKTPSVAVA